VTRSTGTDGNWRPEAVGFLTDTSLCIGCKACEVACKQWNGLSIDNYGFSGFSYDNTVDLGASTWRHVTFVEREASAVRSDPDVPTPAETVWLMMSDVCKHCIHAGCMEACPTGAIIRTEFDSVYIQQDVCNGCGYCVPACPFGVPQLSHEDGTAHKCTLCFDRLRDGMEPACAKACPTDSIRFGVVENLAVEARERVETLRERGYEKASLYGDHELGGTGQIGGLNSLFVLLDDPVEYNLPAAPELPQSRTLRGLVSTAVAALGMGAAVALAMRGSARS
jgi:formate dehydrogenase iron-sulfur subunit